MYIYIHFSITHTIYIYILKYDLSLPLKSKLYESSNFVTFLFFSLWFLQLLE